MEAGQDDRKSGDNGFMQETCFPGFFLFFGRLVIVYRIFLRTQQYTDGVFYFSQVHVKTIADTGRQSFMYFLQRRCIISILGGKNTVSDRL